MLLENTAISYSTCLLCDCIITQENKSKEHIIPQGIGGKKMVSGVLCRDCNSKTGLDWDSKLTKQLELFDRMLRTKHARKKSDRKIEVFINGKKERMLENPDGSLSPIKPECAIYEENGIRKIHVQAADKKLAKQVLKGRLKKITPDFDISAINLSAKEDVAQTIRKENGSFGDDFSYRSMVKSALVFAVKNGVDKKSCPIPLQYLKNNKTKPFFLPFYYEKDLILNRSHNKIFHCVAIHSNDNLLLAYVEYFSVFRCIICLSNTYLGQPIHNSYFVDLVLGKEFIQEFEMPITAKELSELYKYKKSDKYKESCEHGMKKSMGSFMSIIQKRGQPG